MKNLNEAWKSLVMNKSVRYYLNDFPTQGDFRSEIITKHCVCKDALEFDRCLANFCMRNADNLAQEGFSLQIDRNGSQFVFLVIFTGTWEQCVIQENLLALQKVCGTTNWPKLSKQKIKLFYVIDYLEKEVPDNWGEHAEALTGILHWIDHIQDFATDKAGLPEQTVFPGIGLEYNDKENYVLIDDEGEILGAVSAGKNMPSRIEQTIRSGLNNPEVFDIVSIDGLNITIKYIADHGENREMEISLTPLTIN